MAAIEAPERKAALEALNVMITNDLIQKIIYTYSKEVLLMCINK